MLAHLKRAAMLPVALVALQLAPGAGQDERHRQLRARGEVGAVRGVFGFAIGPPGARSVRGGSEAERGQRAGGGHAPRKYLEEQEPCDRRRAAVLHRAKSVLFVAFYSDLLTKLSASFLDSLFIFATVAPQRSSNDVVLVQYAQTAAAWNNSRTVWAP